MTSGVRLPKSSLFTLAVPMAASMTSTAAVLLATIHDGRLTPATSEMAIWCLIPECLAAFAAFHLVFARHSRTGFVLLLGGPGLFFFLMIVLTLCQTRTGIDWSFAAFFVWMSLMALGGVIALFFAIDSFRMRYPRKQT